MSRPFLGGPGPERGPAPAQAPIVDPVLALERYLRMTAVRPRADLIDRIGWRVAQEPPSTAPRRLLAALAALDARGVVRGFRQSLTTAFGPGRRPLMLRVQAAALVVAMVAGIGLGSVAGLAGARHVVSDLTGRPRADELLLPPSPAPSTLPALASPSPETSPQPRVTTRAPRSRPAVTRSERSSRGKEADEPKAPPPPRTKRPDRGDEQREVSEPDPEREDDDKDPVDMNDEDEDEPDEERADDP